MLAEVLAPVLGTVGRLDGRVVLVIGADPEPTRTVGDELARLGADVVTCGPREARPRSRRKSDPDDSLDFAFGADARGAHAALESIGSKWGRLDSLVAVSGAISIHDVAGATPDRLVGEHLARICAPIRAALPTLSRGRSPDLIVVRPPSVPDDPAGTALSAAAGAALDVLLADLVRKHDAVALRTVHRVTIAGRQAPPTDVAAAVAAASAFGLGHAWVPLGSGAWTLATGCVPRALNDAAAESAAGRSLVSMAERTFGWIADTVIGPVVAAAEPRRDDESATEKASTGVAPSAPREPDPADAGFRERDDAVDDVEGEEVGRHDSDDDSELTANPSAVRSAAERAAAAAGILGATARKPAPDVERRRERAKPEPNVGSDRSGRRH